MHEVEQDLVDAVTRIKIADSYGLDLVAILQGDCDPQMICDVVLLARAYIAERPYKDDVAYSDARYKQLKDEALLIKGWRMLAGEP